MDARAVKNALYARHPGGVYNGMPGAWTCIEEWRGIDLLAWSSWSSTGGYARIGYEVKVSRSDLRRELLKPSKRAANVEWCNEFYFAVPKGMLTDEELKYVEPEWEPGDFLGDPCPGVLGERCSAWHGRKTRRVRVPIPTVYGARVPRLAWEYASSSAFSYVLCPTCGGKGVVELSRVEREAPTCWVPRDVGLVVVNGNGTRVVKRSPRRKEVPALGPQALGQLVRWISIRPDPRHHPVREAVAA